MFTIEFVKEHTPKGFWSKVQFNEPDKCWPWMAYKDKDGYGRYSFSKRKKVRTHRYVLMMTSSSFKPELDVLHHCDNPICVNPNHLWQGDHTDNATDRDKKGRTGGPKGSRNGSSKLTEKDIPVIRELIKKGISRKEIAIMHKVSRSTVNRIVWGAWKHA